ncbi:MAG TPA: tetratricopeptide repeat protein [Acidobacteriaceae bacterium]|nr:tetratricopeptide repeat protein [Acidobacteriaceae bacterium]
MPTHVMISRPSSCNTTKTMPPAADYRTLLAQHPEDAAAHGGLGAALAQLQQPDAARAEFDRALALDPSQTATLENYASLELAAGNPQQAQELLTRAIAAGARDAATYQQLAFADQQTRHPVQAEAALHSAIAAGSLGCDQPLPARPTARRPRRSHQCHWRAAGRAPH